ncbi:MAG: hypothetical protein JWQ66_4459 [Mucilaginibacter sp.]|nr:hypothetical protein [Mucilaginibacter sp.]
MLGICAKHRKAGHKTGKDKMKGANELNFCCSNLVSPLNSTAK